MTKYHKIPNRNSDSSIIDMETETNKSLQDKLKQNAALVKEKLKTKKDPKKSQENSQNRQTDQSNNKEKVLICKGKNCGKPLVGDEKGGLCDDCRRKKADKLKNIAKAAGITALAAVTVAGSAADIMSKTGKINRNK